MKQLKWGIDLGGTKIEGVVLSAQNEVLVRQRIPTERQGGYQHIVYRIGLLVQQLSQKIGQKALQIGIGVPGTIDPPTGLIKNANTVVLNGQPLEKDLSNHLSIPVRLANDANCFAIAEAKLGCIPTECPEAKTVFGVILGTGVGGGIVINGKILGGAQGIGGEWGHMFLDQSGGYCYCGKVGCVEAIISGPALERYYAGLAGKIKTMREIASLSQDNHLAAKATMQRFYHYFAKGIANVINVLDPDVVVLGGGLGQIEGLYLNGVPKVKAFLFNPRMDTLFLKPKLGDSAGVFGAACLWDDDV